MSEYVIEVQGISKRYQRGKSGRIQNAGDVFRLITNPFRQQDRTDTHFWALKDVSFGLRQGEILGIIGQNGAGKSTLLKILSRIIAPTQGKAIMRGRVGALLEVGTGFHDELTGRENVFLNGAILGLKNREIVSLFDEIVAFSGVEAFIDTPVKHYSSGMRLRLGFAVAAHLNPEILIVDEVLAVGDDDFRRRSMGKMNSLANEGRTVIFVSHALRTVQQLCTRAIYLRKGEIVADGLPDEVIDQYVKPIQNTLYSPDTDLLDMPRLSEVKSDSPRIRFFTLLDEAGDATMYSRLGEPLRFQVKLSTREAVDSFDMNIRIETSDNIYITTIHSRDYDEWYRLSPTDMLTIHATIDSLFLEPGQYFVSLIIRDKQDALLDHVVRAGQFTVSNVPYGVNAPPMAVVGLVTTRSGWQSDTQTWILGEEVIASK